jgi:hypothetical protein
MFWKFLTKPRISFSEPKCFSATIWFDFKGCSENFLSWGHCYKTFYGRNYATSRIFLYDFDWVTPLAM